jgi:predicted dehydrogenase/threonine dehydrogenase-like Zn-dependent dehydrogenase
MDDWLVQSPTVAIARRWIMTRQVVQEVRGSTKVRTIPAPIAGPGQMVIANAASLVSAGTERYVVELARKSLIGKARERPDQVKRVLQKMKEEGVLATLQQVRAKLDDSMPLGYSSAGVVLECGAGVQAFKPGDRVASTGPHAGVVAVGHNLCARLPDNVSFEDAAYTSVAAIALEGVRLARATLGERVLVMGLGLIGQIAVQLLKAQGCRVFGTDVDPAKLELARKLGADAAASGYPADQLRTFTEGHGVDAVVITAATDSNRPIEFAADVARIRGRIVLVGVTGLNLPRAPFFAKELEFTVSSSLGPGRLDELYSERGHDYPFGQVRWTAQRNMQAIVDLLAEGRLNVRDLTTHRFPIEQAEAAYELVTERREPFFGIILQYGDWASQPVRRRNFQPTVSVSSTQPGVSLVGAGNFARLILLPEIKKGSGTALRGICTARGMSAEFEGAKSGFAFATTDVEELLRDPETRAIVIATRHDLHADLVIRGLRAGKHVFVEKPLATTLEDLERIADCVQSLGDRCPVLTVGFNRRFSPAVARLRSFFAGIRPLAVHHRFAVPSLPAEHWVHDDKLGGGRLIGEACHAIDTCAALADSVPVRVFAESAGAVGEAQVANDRVFITLRLANGSVASVAYQAAGDRGMPAERIEVFGGDRTAVVNAWDEIELWQGGVCKRERAGRDKGHGAEVRAFLDVIRSGGRWPIPWNHILASSEATLLAAASLRDGLPQALHGGEAQSTSAAAE